MTIFPIAVAFPRKPDFVVPFHLYKRCFERPDILGNSGGAVDIGETFEQAALRELKEETGFACETVGEEFARREFELQLPDGEWVLADERLFVVRTTELSISRGLWTDSEKEVITAHRWWS